MKINLAYGKTGLEINLPDDAGVTVLESEYAESCQDSAGELRNSLRRPTGCPSLADLVQVTDLIGIVVSDITRPTPYQLILPVLLKELKKVPEEQIILFVATGTHRPNTQSELEGMLGKEIVERFRIVQNDARNRESHILMGRTKSGNNIWIQKEFVRCDWHILTGFIEPHFFAGFSGGGKAVMPGLALLETVMRNHCAGNIDNPQACWGITRGNPLWEEVNEAAAMVGQNFLLNVTLNRDKEITGVFAGELNEAHAQGCAFVKKKAMVPVKELFDIVISSNSGYPLDLNLYQSVKGMSAAAQVVKEGGSIIMAADCWDGIPEHGDYRQLLFGADSHAALLETIRTPGFQTQDMWQVQVQALVSQKADIFFYSHNLSDEQIKGVHLKPCRNIEATVKELRKRYGSEARICVLPEGPQTIPYIIHDM